MVVWGIVWDGSPQPSLLREIENSPPRLVPWCQTICLVALYSTEIVVVLAASSVRVVVGVVAAVCRSCCH